MSPERKKDLESTVTNEEQQDLRALIGSLQYAAVNTRPDLSSRLSFLQSQVNCAKVQTLIQANKVLHDAKRFKDIAINIQPCKSLYDLVSRTAPPNCQEFRTQLLARSIKDMLAENVSLRWVHSGAQVADALTKEMECSFLRHVLRAGKYQLHDQEQILKERASARNRLKWLQNQENTEQK